MAGLPALGKNRRRRNFLKHFEASIQDGRIIQLADHRNEAGNKLNRAKDVADRTGCYHFAVPRHLGMLHQKRDQTNLTAKPLVALLPSVSLRVDSALKSVPLRLIIAGLPSQFTRYRILSAHNASSK